MVSGKFEIGDVIHVRKVNATPPIETELLTENQTVSDVMDMPVDGHPHHQSLYVVGYSYMISSLDVILKD